MSKLKIYTDGGARGNPGPGAIGVLVCDEQGEELFEHKDRLGESTNNIAEYCALIAGLELARKLKAKEVACFLDSQLVVEQLNGRYKIKHERMVKLFQEVRRQEGFFSKVSYAYLPRTEAHMKQVDRLVNAALDEPQ